MAHDDKHVPRTDNVPPADSRAATPDATPQPASGARITGRSFAGTSIASTEREQTADHRGESEGARLDDREATDPERD